MSLNDQDVISLREKAECLIQRAVDEGAEVDFHRVRELMEIGTTLEMPRLFNSVIAELEFELAAVNREKRKQSSRKPFVLKVKNLFRLS